ncbi:hypothetical protein N3K66_003732 [Trichothecium roseum]|uniref:Uncharacterized protein n=1 Tax=Trichothecium roseum TaxID=47278 RepID=A0ACC0V608_9HYPO|nr:hypothetical protein N3K66_003732 [Trichothecium roseum]
MKKFVLALAHTLLFAGRAASTLDGPGPGPGDQVACTEDELYASLSGSGADFCESLVKLHCEVSTPPEYTTYDAGQISSQCGCIINTGSSQTVTGSSEHVSTSSSPTSATARETSTASRSSDSQSPGSASTTSTTVTVSSSPDTAGSSSTRSTTKRAEDSSGYDLSITASTNSVTVTLLSSVSLTVTKVSSSPGSGLAQSTASSSGGTVLSNGGVIPVTTASYTLTKTVLTSSANSSPGSSSSGYNSTVRTLTSSTVETTTRTLVETVVSSGAAPGSTSPGGAFTSAAGSWNTSTGMQAPNDTVTTTVVSATTKSVSSVSGAPTLLSPTQGGPAGPWNSTAGPIGTGASNGTPIIPVPTGGWNSTKLAGVPAPPSTAPPVSASIPSDAGATATARPTNVTVSELPGPILTPPASVSPSVINGTVVPTVIGGPTFPGWNSSMATSVRPSGSAFSTGSGASVQISVTATPSFPNTTAGVPPSANYSSTTVTTPPPPFSVTTLETFTPFPTASFTGSITGSVTTMVAGLNTSSPIIVPSPTGVPGGNCTLGQACSVIAPSPTAPLGSVIPAANFTGVTRTAFTSQETCYTLSRDQSSGDPSRRALLRNSKLREDNVTIPVPYIESIDFSDQGLDPFFVTVRDSSQGAFYLDVSNRSRVALVDQGGNSLVLDWQGLHLATNSCMLDISFKIDDLYRQLADLSNVSCSTSSLLPKHRASTEKRAEDLRFDQTLYLRDQCGSPVSRAIREFPSLAVGNSSCTNVATDPRSGRWDFECMFPGAASGAMQCQQAIQRDVVDFLTRDSFGDACPSLPTVISTLARSAQDIFDAEALRESFSDAGDGSEAEAEQLDIETTIGVYQRLWAALQELFALSTDGGGSVSGGPATSPLERYISVYDENRSFGEDICEDLHAGEMPLNLSLIAGATRIDAITSLNWAPDDATPYNVTVQDPSAVACCAGGAVADDDGDSCGYPRDAIVADTDCICGRLAGGGSLAFEGTECDRYAGVCGEDGDCRDGLVCVVGTCCGVGVCVDPYACSQNGTALVKVGIVPSR